MEPPKVDQPLKLGRGFGILYLAALLLSLRLLHPWSADDRYMAVLGTILFPFLGSVTIYSLGLIAWAIASDFRRHILWSQ